MEQYRRTKGSNYILMTMGGNVNRYILPKYR